MVETSVPELQITLTDKEEALFKKLLLICEENE